MGSIFSKPPLRAGKSKHRPRTNSPKMDADRGPAPRRESDELEATDEESVAMYDAFCYNDGNNDNPSQNVPSKAVVETSTEPPRLKDMKEIDDKNCIFLIEPFAYDSSRPDHQPMPIVPAGGYMDRWDEDHLRMPCSPHYLSEDGKPIWPRIHDWLRHLKEKCDNRSAKFKDLKNTIDGCNHAQYDLYLLQTLLCDTYTSKERDQFMFGTLSVMCDLVLTLDTNFNQPPPLLRKRVEGSVTMSQRQAASLLACSFFCLFPSRTQWKDYQNPNFDILYRKGPREKIEKLKCILHYFQRVTEKMPNGVITFQRSVLHKDRFPQWKNQKTVLSDLILTTSKKIEDIHNTLQVDFANKYIGGGVLGGGCVQEEIRFSICPEMLVSLLVCEVMRDNECIFLIGCERYSSYKGYANTFEFASDYKDDTPKDSWGRKWCHLVAMDAIYFSNPSTQYTMENVDRELLKAYTSFLPQGQGPDYEFDIATGNWGCGAFKGDRQLKAIIQLMAASAAGRRLIYAAFGDKNLIQSLSDVYTQLKKHGVKVADLYYYLERYSNRANQSSLFDYISTKLAALPES